jgi:hypothetical protein
MSRIVLTRGHVLGLFVTLVCLSTVYDRLVLVTSRSVPYHFALKIGGQAQRGDLVELTIQDKMIEHGHPQAVTKELKCEAGDVLSFDGKSHYCNGSKIDDINLTRTQDGQVINAFVWNGPVPAGKAYVLGDHPHSYDSRYFGFVDASGLHRLRGLV